MLYIKKVVSEVKKVLKVLLYQPLTVTMNLLRIKSVIFHFITSLLDSIDESLVKWTQHHAEHVKMFKENISEEAKYY